MQVGGAGFGSVSLGSILLDPGASNDEAESPIIIEINGLDVRVSVQTDSLTIEDTLGQPVTARFTLVNFEPDLGDPVRIRFFSEVIFSGTIDHLSKRMAANSLILLDCDCLDWSQTLLRRKIQRNFTDSTVQAIVDSILDNELIDEGLTIGTIDARSIIPLVDARGAKIFEVVRSVAAATGQTFYVDYDKSIQMRSTTLPVAPLLLNQGNTLFNGTTLQTDRETYRNRQIVIVTGTPPEGQDAITISVQRENADQIAARAAIEGGTGVYEEIEEITHPTSNDPVEITLLAISYANLRLAVSGTPRLTFGCEVRGYGFRAGQIATVSLDAFGISGTFVIQKVSIREVAGAQLFHTLELTNSSLQQRAYEAWLSIVQAGKVTVQVPSSTTSTIEEFVTPGATTWTVPPGVTTAQFTCIGGSGAGGQGICYYFQWYGGGNAGISGKAVSIVTVIPGQVFDLIVGAAGTPQVSAPFDGNPGTHSQVLLAGVVQCQGDRSTGGVHVTTSPHCANGANGSNGSGVGDAVTVGGGRVGGRGDRYPGPYANPGQDGYISVEY